MRPRAILANLSLLFTDAPLLERFERARRAGFDGVEIQFPYDVPASELGRASVESGMPARCWSTGISCRTWSRWASRSSSSSTTSA